MQISIYGHISWITAASMISRRQWTGGLREVVECVFSLERAHNYRPSLLAVKEHPPSLVQDRNTKAAPQPIETQRERSLTTYLPCLYTHTDREFE